MFASTTSVYKPGQSKGLEVFVDADFSGNWEKSEAPTDRDTARSRYGCFIMYAGCPIVGNPNCKLR